MSRRLIIFDIGLVVLLTLGIMKFREDWLAFEPAHQVSAIQPKPETFPTLPGAAATPGGGGADWTEISTLNAFSFDRNDIAILEPPAPPKPVGPQPILYGTMMMGSDWIAMLSSGDPAKRSSRPIKVGESIDGWTIVEIAEKSVVVEANTTREKLSMDPTQHVPREIYNRSAVASSPPVVQAVGQSAPATSASAPAPNSGSAPPSTPTPAGAQRMCDYQTPFGIAKRVCEDR